MCVMMYKSNAAMKKLWVFSTFFFPKKKKKKKQKKAKKTNKQKTFNLVCIFSRKKIKRCPLILGNKLCIMKDRE